REHASALLNRTRDLRLVLLLTRALTNTEGLSGLGEGLRLCCDLLEQFWDSVHPQLEFEGEPDPIVRINAVTVFADDEGLVSDTRAAKFLESPLGPVTVREVERILAPVPGGPSSLLDPAGLRAAVGDALVKEPQLGAHVIQSLQALDRIRTIFVEHLGAAQAPDLALLRSVLKLLADLIEAAAPSAAGQSDASGAVLNAGGQTASGGDANRVPTARAVGEIRSREDAARALDDVCRYLSLNEPSNPAPLLIGRAKRVMFMPFLDIIRDLAPDAIGQIENVAGIKQGTEP
ncbi:MAG: type VI secretion system ImpA family N-terminal domain-containing protein, partial [Pseudomonadota bacterium]|nr:type VI secretion system ImpA family N-terminal domain-containing protein [Pseudomonadota bacterium]